MIKSLLIAVHAFISRVSISFSVAGSSHVDTAIWMHYLDANKTAGEEAWRQSHKNVANNIEQVLTAMVWETWVQSQVVSYQRL